MSDPQTTNVGFYIPARGSDVGTWDGPVNANQSASDGMFANVASIALTNAPVTLTTPPNDGGTWSGPYQSQSGILRFTGVLTGNCQITLPRAGFWIVENTCTVGAFAVTVASASPGKVVGLPPGEATHVFNDGTDVKYVDFGRVGSYMDLAVTAVPAWISASTVRPYLNCDGTTFSGATYPALAAILGGTTLPDLRGRLRAALNQGTGRMTSTGGVDGNTFGAAGGAQTQTIGQTHLPAYNLSVTDPGHTHTTANILQNNTGAVGFSVAGVWGAATPTTSSATTGISVGLNGGGNGLPTLPPIQIAGLTLIRAG